MEERKGNKIKKIDLQNAGLLFDTSRQSLKTLFFKVRFFALFRTQLETETMMGTTTAVKETATATASSAMQ